MEECPRCGASLERLSLGEVSTVACGRCGYADIPVEHDSEGRDFESWQDALERFYDGAAGSTE
ncbi:zinc finger domain-containing protein [Natrialbaceae archaeon AArc-T1-2]|uniref:zinc finger domain-containing protein n=1 Tax=Natrialbaceae archaeon AArc-T1-2 TaxID=3053904 RepID=UPI00255B0334|nr:zinc finger domain-containing protein [Natrialbaceae archaeon AArc-T1-2]WIV67275.1 zinc finger domain-containing protein [Natrialbaceae archaeon AArc-T1-2]